MNYLLRNLRAHVLSTDSIELLVHRKLKTSIQSYKVIGIIRKALDTRKYNNPYWDYTIELNFPDTIPVHKDLIPICDREMLPVPRISISDSPVIVGMGPAGLFTALAMVESGIKPIIIDRGKELSGRIVDVEKFWESGILSEESNVQFGEGGAGTFSDGKLTSRGTNPTIRRVYDLLIKFGANAAIQYEALPHSGTDGIRTIVSNIVTHLRDRGTRVYYNSFLNDIEVRGGKLLRIKINEDWFQCESLVLALGNSSRDTFRMLHRRGIAMEGKGFAVGFRIEHLQENINRAIYGNPKWADALGAASYRLADRSVYSFCMCPGGQVIAAASEAGAVVTNGMSSSSRDGKYCNSAIVATVDSSTYGHGIFNGIEFQEMIERKCFRESYFAPAQRIEEFLGRTSYIKKPCSSYRPGVIADNLTQLLPEYLTQVIKKSLQKFDHIVHDFCRDSVLIAPETRTSCPVRILRHKENYSSINCSGLYPVGEGSGYSGGIISSAADGYKTGSMFRLR